MSEGRGVRAIAFVVGLGLVAIPSAIFWNVARAGSRETLEFLAPPIVALLAGIVALVGAALWHAGILRAAGWIAGIGWLAPASYHLMRQAGSRGAIDDVVELGAVMLVCALVLSIASRHAWRPHGVATV